VAPKKPLREEPTLEINLANLRNVGFVGELLKHGITDRYLAKKLKAELNAKKNTVHYDRQEGEWTYSAPIIAWDVRQKARMDAQRILNLYPPETDDNKDDQGALNRLADSLKDLRERHDD
jgi:hypothetical protein